MARTLHALSRRRTGRRNPPPPDAPTALTPVIRLGEGEVVGDEPRLTPEQFGYFLSLGMGGTISGGREPYQHRVRYRVTGGPLAGREFDMPDDGSDTITFEDER